MLQRPSRVCLTSLRRIDTGYPNPQLFFLASQDSDGIAVCHINNMAFEYLCPRCTSEQEYQGDGPCCYPSHA
jgi:hypothetical protein